ncbi:2-phosphosulfolactate phosphatase [Peribacillus sp. SCS-155]|uniref:2-phosphosulfolactate phosphatase n=1 Tax=Peribacillus sedimenti TaxID=3115297 RepID=UPI003905AAD5
MALKIYQGSEHQLAHADINIVIDVIRAFTVAHYAFINGVEEILLAGTVEDAWKLKESNPHCLLAGEVNGVPIEGFELDNSPARIAREDLTGRILVQKTTNGVKATLNALQADFVFVTGFSNARTTAEYVSRIKSRADRELTINIIASHPTSDDDLACAEYMAGIIDGKGTIQTTAIQERIRTAEVTEKFFDPHRPEFDPEDILFCMRETETPFVMKVNTLRQIPTIERIAI